MTKIQWTNKTWNPIVGCTKVSEGCKNCYAERFAWRLAHNPRTFMITYAHVVTDGKWNGNTYLNVDVLTNPTKWKKPCMIFVVSMGDLFHESIPFEWIDAVFSVMSDCDRHTYQVLTKRPQRILDFIQWKSEQLNIPWIPKENIWFGVTTENQEQAQNRIPILLKVPAKVKFVSCEPLLSDIDFSDITIGNQFYHTLKGIGDLSPWPTEKLNWVIAGPETGPGARNCDRKWIYNIYKQCVDANVPFFDKKNILELNNQYPI